MKYEWRKQGKALYGARTAPALKTVPAQNYIKIDGRGDPNGADFSNRVGALYVVAYAVKAAYKAASLQQEIDDFAVCPLEGVWAQIRGDELEKDKLEYTLTIRQPDFISGELVRQAQEQVQRKKPNPLLGEITFGAMQYFRGSYGKVEMAPMMACIMITVIPVIVLYLACQKYIIDGVVAGAVKG